MKICVQCKSLMDRVITDAGVVVFQCTCGRSEKGASDDTLIMCIPIGGSITTPPVTKYCKIALSVR